jgi:hypothetical protein
VHFSSSGSARHNFGQGFYSANLVFCNLQNIFRQHWSVQRVSCFVYASASYSYNYPWPFNLQQPLEQSVALCQPTFCAATSCDIYSSHCGFLAVHYTSWHRAMLSIVCVQLPTPSYLKFEIKHSNTNKNRLESLGPPFCYAIQELEA